MKTRTLLLSLFATTAMAVCAQEAKKVFIYSPDERAGTSPSATPAYHTQRLFAVYGGDRYVSTRLDIAPALRHRVGASLVRDTKTARRYLKLVNALPVELTLRINGLNIPAGSHFEQFSGQPEDQKTAVTRGTTTAAAITLPPYAFRVIAL